MVCSNFSHCVGPWNVYNNQKINDVSKESRENPINNRKTNEISKNNQFPEKKAEIIKNENPPLIQEEIVKRPSYKSFDVRVFLEKNQDKFSNEEYGLICCMDKNQDAELKRIIYQCQNLKNQEVFICFYNCSYLVIFSSLI